MAAGAPGRARESPGRARPLAGLLRSVLGPPDPVPSQRPGILPPPLPPLPRAPRGGSFSDLPSAAPGRAPGPLSQSCAPSDLPGSPAAMRVTFPKPQAGAGAPRNPSAAATGR